MRPSLTSYHLPDDLNHSVALFAVADAMTIASTLVRASANDPVSTYLRDTPACSSITSSQAAADKNSQDAQNPDLYECAETLQFALSALLWFRTRIAFTVDNGRSVELA